MWNNHVPGRASLEEQNIASESGKFSLSLSLSLSLQAPPRVCLHELDSSAEHVAQV